MTSRISRLNAIALLLGSLAILASGLTGHVRAQEVTPFPWQKEAHSRIRLISASAVPYGGRLNLVAGLEIELEPGWKTYWRNPGDGLAPSIEWNESANLKKAELLWPAPHRLSDPGGLTAFGYKGRIILPILISPVDKSKAVNLRLRILYGVCADICIPVETEIGLEIGPQPDKRMQNVIRPFLERVPRRQRRGVYCPHRFVTAKYRTVKGKPALIVKTASTDQARGLDLFAEASDGAVVPIPQSQPRTSRGRHYYVLSFETWEAANALKGQLLRLTMTSEQGSCETAWRVK